MTRAATTSLRIVLLIASLALAPGRATADVIDAPPRLCPPGTDPYADHGGTGCRPDPPDDCPEGFAGRVRGETAYCEPPPAEACPTGSFASSFGPDRPYCRLGRECEDDSACPPGASCRPTRLCTARDVYPRFADPRAYGTCETDADCDEDQVCNDAPRCDPDVHRVDPEGRTRRATVEPSSWTPALMCLGCCALGVLGLLAAGVVLIVRGRRARSEG